ncbi:MAG TPA: LCP family protein [Actinomycetota bacterium]|nr:LCP family protein [Actinomycetota bacterium]
MSEGKDRTIGIAVTIAMALFVLAAGPWFHGGRGSPAPVSSPSVGPTPSPTPSPSMAPAFELSVRLGRVSGRSPAGAVAARRLFAPAEAVLDTMTELYSIGFVDPDRWAGGRFPGLLRLFAPDLRRAARHDLRSLTLGRAVGKLEAVRPVRARLDVRFATDPARHPLAAFAEMDFAGVAIAGDAELPIRHGGRFVLRRSHGRWRIAAYDVRSRVPSPGEIRAEARKASGSPEIASRDLLFLLVIGSDARPGQAVQATRADSIHIVGVNPTRHRASIVGIPRDSYVSIPGGGVDKINAALARGGPELVVATVERLTGIRIDGYLLTGFEGFERAVSAVGGIDIVIPYPISDRYSHAQFRRGRTHLSGREALAFSRNRHDAPGGDFGRSLNQGRLLIAALREMQAAMRGDRLGLVPWVFAATNHLRTDLSLGDLIDLALAAPAIDADLVRNTVVSGRGGSAGGRSVIFLGAAAATTFRDLARDAILGR